MVLTLAETRMYLQVKAMYEWFKLVSARWTVLVAEVWHAPADRKIAGVTNCRSIFRARLHKKIARLHKKRPARPIKHGHGFRRGPALELLAPDVSVSPDPQRVAVFACGTECRHAAHNANYRRINPRSRMPWLWWPVHAKAQRCQVLLGGLQATSIPSAGAPASWHHRHRVTSGHAEAIPPHLDDPDMVHGQHDRHRAANGRQLQRTLPAAH